MQLRTILLAATIATSAVAQTLPTTRPYTATTVEEAVTQLHERGYPATLADLGPKEVVPDDANSAKLLTKAAELIVPEKSGPSGSNDEFGPWLPYPQKWFDLAQEAVQANKQVLDLVRQARDLNKVAWTWDQTKSAEEQLGQIQSGLAEQRAIANLVGDVALLDHFRGEDTEPFERMRDLRFIADAEAQRPMLVSYLMTLGTRAIIGRDYLQIGATLSGRTTADRKVVHEAINWLLEEQNIRDSARRAVLEERVCALALCRTEGLAAVPRWQRELPEILKFYDQLAEAVAQPFWKRPAPLTGTYKALYEPLVPSMERVHYPLDATSVAAAWRGRCAGNGHVSSGP